MTVFGVKLLGINAHNGEKLLFTIAAVIVFLLVRRAAAPVLSALVPRERDPRVAFWGRQIVSLTTLVLLFAFLTSVWFDDPNRLATFAGLLTAGIAFALQRVITAFAAYLIILRGATFSVGDRIVMGDVRGNVIALDPFQTTIMEMGEAPGEQGDAPSVWIHGRQFTGRIVTVNNGVIFERPVYNYSRDFPYIWEEISLPVPYDGDDARAEAIMLEAVRRHAVVSDAIERAIRERLARRYGLQDIDLEPRAFYTLTDNWIAIAVRFLVSQDGARAAKDAIFRDVLAAFRAAHISVASGTYQIVGVPPVHVITEPAPPA